MSFFENVNDYHLDILKEIGNIGAGNATTALSKILNKSVEMTVPFVKLVSFNEMTEIVGGADQIVASVYLRIEGDAPGSMYFMLPIENATKLVKDITNETSFSFNITPYPEIVVSALEEVGNIVTGSYLSALSDFTNLQLSPSVPELAVDMVGAVLTHGLMPLSPLSDHAIVIDTAVIEKNDDVTIERVKGHFILLPDPQSFQKIFQSLGVSFNE